MGLGLYLKACTPKVCSIKKLQLDLSGARVISKGVCAKSLHEQQKKAVWVIVGLGCVTSIDVDSNGVLHQQKKTELVKWG